MRQAASAWEEGHSAKLTVIGYERGKPALSLVVHHDGFTALGPRVELVKKLEAAMRRNRSVEWAGDTARYEADPRSVEAVIKELGLQGSPRARACPWRWMQPGRRRGLGSAGVGGGRTVSEDRRAGELRRARQAGHPGSGEPLVRCDGEADRGQLVGPQVHLKRYPRVILELKCELKAKPLLKVFLDSDWTMPGDPE